MRVAFVESPLAALPAWHLPSYKTVSEPHRRIELGIDDDLALLLDEPNLARLVIACPSGALFVPVLRASR